MPEHALLQDLLIVLAAAIVVVVALHRLRLPAIAGFLVAGALIGPSGLGLIAGSREVGGLAEIGVVMLLFTIGLEFSLESLRRIARMVSVGGALQVGLTLGATLGVASAWGASLERALFAGFIVALSSTAIVLRGLSERGEVDAPHGRVIVGVLLFQDLCVVPMMLVVPMLAAGSAHALEIGAALAKAAVVMVLTVVLARWIVPRVFRAVARTHRRDVFLLAVVAVCAGIAWATSLVGLSLALGAFLAGLVLADSEYGHQALSDVLPLRDLFTSLFFVSIGMLLDLDVLRAQWSAVAGLALALLAGKFVLATIAALLMRLPLRVALLSGAALAQVGEFSFVLVDLGGDLGLMSANERALFLDASVLTMLVTPLALRLGPHIAASARRLERLERLLGGRSDAGAPEREQLAGHVVVLGYGVGGELLSRALRRAQIPCAVVDLDVERVSRARARGEQAWFGDVTSPDILKGARVEHAAQVAVLLNDPEATFRTVRNLRALAPSVPVVARARYLADAPRLRGAGATHVVAQEVEGSLHVTAEVLERAQRTGLEIAEILEGARDNLGAD